jgi:hypothetical protein
MTSVLAANGARHVWRFFRAGGFDQIRLDRGADLANLRGLDQKLWVALAGPAQDIEFDHRTLSLIDTSDDGRIRVPELLTAVEWAVGRVKDPDTLVKGEAALPLAAINDSTDEGRRILSSARQILINLGKPDAEAITPDDTADTQKIFAATRFNGDGVVPPESADDAETTKVIVDIVACLGGDVDRKGCLGVTRARLERFFDEAQAFADWIAQSIGAGLLPLSEQTSAAFDLLAVLRAKIDDFFVRCRLAACRSASAQP